MFVDYILNGEPHGEVGERMCRNRWEGQMKRPWRAKNGKDYVAINTGEVDKKGLPKMRAITVNDAREMGIDVPTTNALTLRKDEWKLVDKAVLTAARPRLRAWRDLAAANTYGGFNGMSKLVLEHETQSDPGSAVIDMDGLADSQTDAPIYQLEGLPLPIVHSGFFYSERRLSASRNSGTPLDTTMAEKAGRRVAETIEQLTIGTLALSWAYGDTANYGTSAGKIWGYTTHPDRITKTDLTIPDGTNGSTTVDDVLAMIQLASNSYFYGPFMLYHSSGWDQYMDDDYRANDARTLRGRLRQIDAIVDVRRLDYLTSGYQLLLVQMTADVARAVNGMDITTLMWESKGGLQVNFKVMAIQVPQLRSDYNGNMGLVHATTS